jgi:hypothetical protein
MNIFEVKIFMITTVQIFILTVRTHIDVYILIIIYNNYYIVERKKSIE